MKREQKKQVAILVPVYKSTLSELEQISFQQLLRVLGKYPIFFVGPHGLSVNYGENACDIPFVGFPKPYFSSVSGYSRLMLEPFFYRFFEEYEYILIYQLDAFVFNDRLEEFCNMGYDYWGAPVYRSFPHWQVLGLRVGNGGFSLRKVSSAIRALEENESWVRNNPFRDVLEGWEDLFWSYLGGKDDYDFRCPPVNLAIQFSVQDDVCHAFKDFRKNNTFGCHGWNKPDSLAKWQDLIAGAGYESVREVETNRILPNWREMLVREYLFHREGVNTNLLIGYVKRREFTKAEDLVKKWLARYPDRSAEWCGLAEIFLAALKLCLCYDLAQEKKEVQTLILYMKQALLRIIGAPCFQPWTGLMVEDLIEFSGWKSDLDAAIIRRLEFVKQEIRDNNLLQSIWYNLHNIEINHNMMASVDWFRALLENHTINAEQLSLIAEHSTRNPNNVLQTICGKDRSKEERPQRISAEAGSANKICFIACVNDQEQFEKFCMAGLRRLVVPEGMSVEVLTIDDAPSMTVGYEKARCTSNAKYKVYLHQDVEIVNPNFIVELLSIFSRDELIGIAGMIGVGKLSSNGAWWDSCSNGIKGRVKCTRVGKPEVDLDFHDQTGGEDKPYEDVAVADGLLIATQYDIPWRADIIGNWHYYDISQCLEYRRHGYKVVVPRQEKYWVIHHERDKNIYSWLFNWDVERKKCLKEYWTEIVSAFSNDDKRIEILITDRSGWEGTGKYDYLRELVVPTGYSLNVTITKGSWKARDYREFQEEKPAKYRIYIDEETKIVNLNFLIELLEAFSVSNRIGIIGVAGKNCRKDDVGGQKCLTALQSGVPMVPVDMVTGGFVATQQSVMWDDIRYCGDSFVTEAACLDMARRGYLSMVVRQELGKEWVKSAAGTSKEISGITLSEIGKGADEVHEKALCLMQERNVINFRDCDRGEIFRKEYEADWGKIDKRLPENRLEEAPLVSVVMPVWNAEKYIGAAIESVQAQTYQNFELMLAEDCPTDNTAAVVAAYAEVDKRLRVLKNDRNHGIAYTTNRAIAEARGKYIALLDDDDLMTPWRLELQVAYLEQHPEIDVLGGGTVNVYEDGKIAQFWYTPPRCGDIHANLLLNMGGFANGTGMIRRRFIIKNRLAYEEDACGMQDVKFYMDASPLGRIDAIPDVLLYSRQHVGQETRVASGGDRMAERAAKYAQFQRESLEANGILLDSACLTLLNRICDEAHAGVCVDEKELRQFTAVIVEIYRQVEEKKIWFGKEVGELLASRVWEQCNKLGIKEPPKVTPADLPQ